MDNSLDLVGFEPELGVIIFSNDIVYEKKNPQLLQYWETIAK